jgi:hypothetical protein
MKPVTQEITTGGEGDCLSACLASLLELEIGQVPKFLRDYAEGMLPAARSWLVENFGLSLICFYIEKVPIRWLGAAPGQLCIAVGRSAVPGGLYHAVVGRLSDEGRAFEIIHDPHPLRRGITGRPRALYFLVPVSPKSQVPKVPKVPRRTRLKSRGHFENKPKTGTTNQYE